MITIEKFTPALDRLADKERRAIEMRYLENKTYQQISEEFGSKYRSTGEQWVKKAERKLRAYVK
jgi:RNA polymerase sigma factor (sigma-70 family)